MRRKRLQPTGSRFAGRAGQVQRRDMTSREVFSGSPPKCKGQHAARALTLFNQGSSGGTGTTSGVVPVSCPPRWWTWLFRALRALSCLRALCVLLPQNSQIGTQIANQHLLAMDDFPVAGKHEIIAYRRDIRHDAGIRSWREIAILARNRTSTLAMVSRVLD
jgi:hypothetical protein